MYKKPCEDVLDPERSKALNKEQIENDVAVLTEIINYGTFAIKRCMTSHSGQVDVDLAPHFLYMHIMEMTDGVRVLTSQASFLPGVPLVRSMFEALLSLDFIFDDDYENRSLTWLVCKVFDLIKEQELFDPKSDKYRELMKRVDGNRDEHIRPDRIMRSIPPIPPTDKSEALSGYRRFLRKPHVDAIAKKYQEKRKPPKHWWMICELGIGNISVLADRVGLGATYRMLYPRWSSFSHARDIRKLIASAGELGTAFERLRSSSDREHPAHFAAIFALKATEAMLQKFRHEESESYGRWYRDAVRERFRRMEGPDSV